MINGESVPPQLAAVGMEQARAKGTRPGFHPAQIVRDKDVMGRPARGSKNAAELSGRHGVTDAADKEDVEPPVRDQCEDRLVATQYKLALVPRLFKFGSRKCQVLGIRIDAQIVEFALELFVQQAKHVSAVTTKVEHR
jgi:hypothetical protein